MSIVWATIALLVLLLPGFLFFIGLTTPEKFTREAAARSPLGQLAGTLSVSLGVHTLLYLLTFSLTSRWIPYPHLEYVLAVLQLEGSRNIPLAELAANIEHFRWWIATYLLASSAAGFGAGVFAGSRVVQGKWQFLTQHRWIFDLAVEKEDGYTIAYVLTHVREGKRVLMYNGFVKHFGLAPDGRFSYIVLKDCRRAYLVLADNAIETSPTEQWRRIGQNPKTRAGTKIVASYLVIEGEDIANVVFDSVQLVATEKGSTILEQLLQSGSIGPAGRAEFDRLFEQFFTTVRPPKKQGPPNKQ